MFYDNLANNTVVVTGGAGGIGVELITMLCQAHADLLIIDPDAPRLEKLKSQLAHYTGKVAYCDSTLISMDECRSALAKAPSNLIALVHLAGLFEPDPDNFDDTSHWDNTMANNLTNAKNMCLLFAEQSQTSPLTRRIVLTSSLAANRGSYDHYSYTAAKAGLIGLTRAFSRRFAPDILVNCIAPGIILTRMTTQLLNDRADKIQAEIPLKRFGEPAEIASVIMFLISDGASYINGQLINIDGGTVHS